MSSRRISSRFTRIALALGVLAMLQGCSEDEGRVALGTLERDRITLTATAPEIIVSQPVAEGSRVEPGQLLVQLDTTLQSAAVAKVEADIALQQAILDELLAGFRNEEIDAAVARADSAKAALMESEREFDRIQGIAARGLASMAQLDNAQTGVETNAARLRDAEAQLELLRAGNRNEDIAQAEAMLRASEAQLAGERQRLNNLSVTATRAGMLDSLPWHEGERVAAGQQLAIVLADGAPYARVYIPETSRAAIAVGTRLTVHVDGVAEPIAGEVRWIAQEPAFTPYFALNSTERSRLVYLAEIQLPESAANLPVGLPAQAELP